MTGLTQYLIVLLYAPLLITSQRHKQVTVELSVLPEKPVIGEDTLKVRCQGLVNSFPDNINIYSILFFAANAKNGERTLLVNIEKNQTTWIDQQLQHHAEISRPSDDNTVVELLMAPALCSDQRVYSCSMQTSYGTFQSQTENTILKGLGIKNTTYPAENANTVSYAAIFVGSVIGFIAIIVLLTTGIYYGVQYKQVVLEYFQRICPWLWKDVKDTDSVTDIREDQPSPHSQEDQVDSRFSSPILSESEICQHDFIVKQNNKEFIIHFPANQQSRSTNV
ncbi:uncharacterized protein LOC118763481 [Octopus sinensis]|uniref:Uncharacterized protein LOC118763481 n=1 Tax=Octopus sinensis TaxID=2607531 RepID=A0A7E6EVP5_9MOLL|nr:uncharacterized protein LOC118763481 [Octopus sinensis]